jgi:hypothetical protein
LKVAGLIWLEDIVQKLLRKHATTQEEVAEVFVNNPRFRFVEKGHRSGENIYAAWGRALPGDI